MSQQVAYLLSQRDSNRLRYIAHWVLTEQLGLTVQLVTTANDLPESAATLEYGDEPTLENAVFIKNHGLLFEKGWSKQTADALLGDRSRADFDLFAAAFFLLSRYEEYTADPSVFDAHGRFPAAASGAARLGFLREPIVNQWVIQLGKRLQAQFPHLQVAAPQYRFQPTYDIDQAWAFLHKGLIRNVLGYANDVLKTRWHAARKRLQVLRGQSPDPEFTFDYIEQLNELYQLKPIFFWLLGDYGRFDKNIPWQNPAFEKLVRSVSARHSVGIHPSYRSNGHFGQLTKEIARLHQLAPQAGSGLFSRQHFLKLRFPDTYRALLRAGVTDDFSLGYADDLGFRAGVAASFLWYDLDNECVTPLRLHPFAVMDVTLQQYLALTPDEAVAQVRPLVEATRAVGGTFTTLWHNSTLSDVDEWQGWRRAYETIVTMSV